MNQKTDLEFNVFVNVVIPYLFAEEARLLVSIYTPTLNSLLSTWNIVFPQSEDANQSTETIRDTKDETRDSLEDTLEQAFNDIPESVLTDADKNTLEWHVRDTVLTPVPVNDKAPILSILTMAHLVIDLKIENPNNPDKRALPPGNKVILERFVGPTPTEPPLSQQLLSSQSTIAFGNAQVLSRSKAKIQFGDQDMGKTAWLRACYTNRRGDKSPYSLPVSFVVN